MAVRLLLDECSQANILIGKLRDAGHDVLTVNKAGLRTAPDLEVFIAAINENRILLTHNCADFVALHNGRMGQGLTHPGVFLIYTDNAGQDTSYDQVVKAIFNLEATAIPLASACHCLNHFNY